MVEILGAHRIKTGTSRILSFGVADVYESFTRALFLKGSRRPVDVYTLRIDLPRRPRTTGPGSQSAHANGHIAQIAVATGASFQAVKEYCKHEAIGEGFGFTTLPNGDIVAISEADASVEQASVLIETIHRLAAEWSIHLVEE